MPARERLKALKGATAALTGVVFAPDNKSVLAISQDRFIHQWDVATGNVIKKMGPTTDDPYGIAFSRDGKQLATSGYAGFVNTWNLADGKPIFTRKLKTFGAYCISFTPDGKALVTGHDKDFSVLVTPLPAP